MEEGIVLMLSPRTRFEMLIGIQREVCFEFETSGSSIGKTTDGASHCITMGSFDNRR
jgi:hypothetical protein